MQIERPRLRTRIAAALERSRGVVLVGPRQVGKTTLARSFLPAGARTYFDLEDPRVEAQLESPMLAAHPKSGASWEAFALEQVLQIAAPDEAWFWATHAGAELDLLMIKNGRRVGIEFKRTDAPRLTPSMRIALRDLRLDVLYAIYPGERRYALADGAEAVPLSALLGCKNRGQSLIFLWQALRPSARPAAGTMR